MPSIEFICVEITFNMINHTLENDIQIGATTLADGYPSLMTLLSEMNHFFPRKKWKEAQALLVDKLVEAIKREGILNGSIFTGTGGICMMLDQLSKDDPSFRGLHLKFHHHLLSQIENQYITPFQGFIDNGLGVPPRLYDSIMGVGGLMTYLLDHVSDHKTLDVVTKILSLLVDLTKPITISGQSFPGWLIPGEYKNISEQQYFGYLDTGLAHGITGPLIALSKALIRGISLDGQESAIKRIVFWLQMMRQDLGEFSSVWPPRFGVESPNEGGNEIIPKGYRDGWCYGAPGVVFALFIASYALHDKNLKEYSVEAMKQMCERIQLKNTLHCLSFCHGYAGPLTVLHQFYLATGEGIFNDTAEVIVKKMESRFDPQLPFGFKSYIPGENDKEVEGDSIGLIGGSTGILLSLLFRQSNKPRPWLQIFQVG